jgi:hypothetical protein
MAQLVSNKPRSSWPLGVVVIILALLSIDATEEGRMEDSPAAGEGLGLR